MTLGEYRVGITFNPSNNQTVSDIKIDTATLIDNCQQIADDSDNPEVKRLAALAMTHYEDAAMWAVKAATKQSRS